MLPACHLNRFLFSFFSLSIHAGISIEIEISFAATAMALVFVGWVEFKLELFMMSRENQTMHLADRRRHLLYVGVETKCLKKISPACRPNRLFSSSLLILNIEICFSIDAAEMALVSVNSLEFELESFMMSRENDKVLKHGAGPTADGAYIPHAHPHQNINNAVIVLIVAGRCVFVRRPTLTKHHKIN
eukprot:scaffold16392_cov40-Cyclotella_meneghiniana.AAC.3